MASRNLTEEDYKEIKKYFSDFNKDADGCVSKAALRRGLQAIGRNPTQQDVVELMSELGVKGELNYKEFEKCMRVMLEEIDVNNEEELRDAFKVFDKDGNGMIDKDELAVALKERGEKLTAEEVDELFTNVDINGDGKINYEEFVKWMSK